MGRGGGVTAVPFPQAAHRTRRAPLNATGSPRSLPLPGLDPGVGDGCASVSVAGNAYLLEVEQHSPIGADRSPPAGVVGEMPTQRGPPPAVPGDQPTRDPPPEELAQMFRGVRGHGMPEVVRPAAQDLVQPNQCRPEVGLGRPVGQGPRNLAFNALTGRSAMKV